MALACVLRSETHDGSSPLKAMILNGYCPNKIRPSLPKACRWLAVNVLVQAEKIFGVVLSLDGREPAVVGTKSGFDGIFPLVTQEVQQIPTAGERAYRLCQSPSPFDMVLRLTRVSPLRKDGNGILGFTLRKRSFGHPNRLAAPP